MARGTTKPAADQTVEADPPAPEVGLEIQDHIGRKLRAVYNEILSEPVPEHLVALLDKLSGAERSGS